MNLMEASNQWRARPADERFVSLLDLQAQMEHWKARSGSARIGSRDLKAEPFGETDGKNNGIVLVGPKGNPVAPTHWAFGQICSMAHVPAGYLREQEVPAPLAADMINWGLMRREVEQVQVLLRDQGAPVLAAMTGPTYGRIWNADVTQALVNQFGDGVTGHFRVPGEFGKKVEITKSNTTIYGSDHDMFVFLADEERRIEVPNRRGGKSGSMARGFFVKNSEVGAGKAEIWGFLFDYVCCNRIVWGAQDVTKIEIRHTSNAPGRWIEEAAPALRKYAASSTATLTLALEEAKKDKLGDDVLKFLANRFTTAQAKRIMDVHMKEEGRPIETRWDAVVGITAYAKGIEWQDERVKLEKEAGKLLA